jgi:hypothetical protein
VQAETQLRVVVPTEEGKEILTTIIIKIIES